MKKLFYVILLSGISFAGYAQHKPAAKSKTTKAPKPEEPPVGVDTTASPEEIRIGALPDKEDTTAPVRKAIENLPPLPAIDTIPPPDDELTTEIRKLLKVTNSMGAAVATMKGMIEARRNNPSEQLPQEFYNRFVAAIDNGMMLGLLENIVVKIYRQKFNVAEMKEVNKFYESPVGKKMASEVVSIASMSMAEGQKVGQFVALKIIRDMMKDGSWQSN